MIDVIARNGANGGRQKTREPQAFRRRERFIRMKAEIHAMDAQDVLANPVTDEEIRESCALADRRDHLLRRIMTTPANDRQSIVEKLQLLSAELQRQRINGTSSDGREIIMLGAIQADVLALDNEGL